VGWIGCGRAVWNLFWSLSCATIGWREFGGPGIPFYSNTIVMWSYTWISRISIFFSTFQPIFSRDHFLRQAPAFHQERRITLSILSTLECTSFPTPSGHISSQIKYIAKYFVAYIEDIPIQLSEYTAFPSCVENSSFRFDNSFPQSKGHIWQKWG